MKIIILGAGQVGTSIAENLASENYDITVVDLDGQHLANLQDRLDIRTVTGHASYPEVLIQAGAEEADLILAVTNNDEVNMVACQLAYTLFHTPTKIARIRAPAYLSNNRIFSRESIALDVIISPEELVTRYIEHLIEYPGTLQVLDFSNEKVQMVALKAYYGGPLVGHELRDLHQHLPKIDTRIAAIFRRGQAIIPDGHTIIEANDEVFFIAARENIRQVMRELRKLDKPYKRIIIAGGGNIGMRLARALETRYQVKVIDHNAQRTRMISEMLDNTIVLEGDCADKDLLLEENIEHTDVFCALTNADEANILSAMLAKRLGARKVMALINRSSYVDLVESDEIDIAISPQQITIGSLLSHIRQGDIVVVHSLRRGAAEAIEAIAHGDPRSSQVVGRTVDRVKLPPGTSIIAIVRDDEVIIAHHNTLIQEEDHVILFMVDKKRVHDVERLFQTKQGFFS
jgi:trk system potassium uptake protein TrkA